MEKLDTKKKAPKSVKKRKKTPESLGMLDHKKAFEQLLDDSIFGVKKK